MTPVRVDVEVGSEEWLAERRKGITASEVAIILGLAPEAWSSPYDLYHQKRTGLGGRDNDAMQWGHDLEAAILKRFARNHPELAVEPGGLYRHEDRPWQMATPDGLARELVGVTTWEGPPEFIGGQLAAVVQAKAAARWEAWGDEGTDEIPVYYRCQVLWEMDVMGVDLAYVPVLVPPFGYREYVVSRDADDLAVIREAAEEFLDRIRTGDEPDIDDRSATTRALRQQYEAGAEGDVEVPATLVRQWKLADRLETLAGQRKRLAENRIRHALGEGRRILVDGKPAGTRSVFPRNDIDTKALRRNEPELAAKYNVKSTVNQLRMRRDKDPTHAR